MAKDDASLGDQHTFSGEANGCLRIRSLIQAWERIDELAERVRTIEARLADQKQE